MTVDAAAKRALMTVARRWRALDEEVRELSRHIKAILDAVAAPLVAVHGVGYETAGQLLVTAGDNPRASRPREVLRCALRLVADPSLVRQNHPAPPQSRWRPARQLRVVDHRSRSHDEPPPDEDLRRAPDR